MACNDAGWCKRKTDETGNVSCALRCANDDVIVLGTEVVDINFDNMPMRRVSASVWRAPTRILRYVRPKA